MRTVLLLISVWSLTFCKGLDDDIFTRELRNQRISGGTEATRNQFPYQVAIFAYTKTGQAICGGSILSANWVLSAAHCFKNFESADILAGVHNVINDDAAYDHEVFPSDIFNHPSYNSVNHLNDISCVRTSRKPIPFSTAIQPIVLIPRSMASSDLTNTVAKVAGWGRTNDIKEETSHVLWFINAPIVSNADCTKIYGNIVTSSNVCLSGASSKSTCQGDSGGPLTILYGNREVQVGIVSFGSENGCQRGYPTVFSRVSSFQDWIQTTTLIKIV